jgi:hypothetical protein
LISLFGTRIAVELAEQGIAVTLRPVGEMLDELLDLGAGSLFQRPGATIVDRVGFHEFGLELVLADELAKAVTDSWTAIAILIAITGPRLTLARLRAGHARSRKGPDLFDRTETNAVRLAESPIDGPGLGYPDLSPTHQWRHVRRVGVAVADKARGASRRMNGCL